MTESKKYVIRGGVEGRERLRILARVMHGSTASLLDRLGIGDGLRCLDVGCGGGDVTLELARRVGPRGRAMGADIDETKLDLARRGRDDIDFADDIVLDLIFQLSTPEINGDVTPQLAVDLLRRYDAATYPGLERTWPLASGRGSAPPRRPLRHRRRRAVPNPALRQPIHRDDGF